MVLPLRAFWGPLPIGGAFVGSWVGMGWASGSQWRRLNA